MKNWKRTVAGLAALVFLVAVLWVVVDYNRALDWCSGRPAREDAMNRDRAAAAKVADADRAAASERLQAEVEAMKAARPKTPVEKFKARIEESRAADDARRSDKKP